MDSWERKQQLEDKLRAIWGSYGSLPPDWVEGLSNILQPDEKIEALLRAVMPSSGKHAFHLCVLVATGTRLIVFREPYSSEPSIIGDDIPYDRIHSIEYEAKQLFGKRGEIVLNKTFKLSTHDKKKARDFVDFIQACAKQQ